MVLWDLLGRKGIKPQLVAKKIGKLMDSSKTESLFKIYVPARFEVMVSNKEMIQIEPYKSSMVKEITEFIVNYADVKGYHLLSEPEVKFEVQDESSANGLKINRFKVIPILHNVQREVESVSDNTMVFDKPDFSLTREHDTTLVFKNKVDTEPNLEVIEGPDKGKIFILQGSVITIGRREDNQVVLNDTNVSRYHARIICRRYWRIADLKSTNGVAVNGRQVKSFRLKSDDEIQIGSTLLKFRLK